VRGVTHGTSSSQLEGRFGRLVRALRRAAFPGRVVGYQIAELHKLAQPAGLSRNIAEF
jgi:hypothetical protein